MPFIRMIYVYKSKVWRLQFMKVNANDTLDFEM